MTLPDRGTFLQLGTLNNQDAADAHAAVRDQVAFNGSAWEVATPYIHPCRTRGSDGVLYDSVQNSTGQDPTTDTSNTYWKTGLEPWVYIGTLNSGWTRSVNFEGQPELNARLRLFNNKSSVQLCLSLDKASGASDSPFTMPIEFRPPTQRSFVGVSENPATLSRININSNGAISIKKFDGSSFTSATFLSFTISYDVI